MKNFTIEKKVSTCYILASHEQGEKFDSDYYFNGSGDAFLNMLLRRSLTSGIDMIFSTISDKELQKRLPRYTSPLDADPLYLLEVNKSKEDILRLLNEGNLWLSEHFTGKVIDGHELAQKRQFQEKDHLNETKSLKN